MIEETEDRSGESRAGTDRQRPSGLAGDPIEVQDLDLPWVGDVLERRWCASGFSARRISRTEDTVAIALVHPRGRAPGAATRVHLGEDEVPGNRAVDPECLAIAVFERDRVPSTADVRYDAQAVGVACAAAGDCKVGVTRPGQRGGCYPLAWAEPPSA